MLDSSDLLLLLPTLSSSSPLFDFRSPPLLGCDPARGKQIDILRLPTKPVRGLFVTKILLRTLPVQIVTIYLTENKHSPCQAVLKERLPS